MNVDFFLKFTKFHVGSLVAAEDFADKFNYQLTPMLLMMFVTIVGIRQYVFTPIQCWIPKEFDKAWEEYTENYCWIQDTYYHSIAAGPQASVREREGARIGYYQWVPFVLGAQALCFYMPHILWKILSMRAGANVNQMIRFAAEATTIDQDKKAKMIRYLGKHVEKLMFARIVPVHGSMSTSARLNRVLQFVLPCFWFRKRNGFGLFALYIVIKFVYLSNCTSQLWLMQSFIGHNSSFFGLGIISDLMARRSWEESGIFPRVTWCDFVVRGVGQAITYSVQCVLPINMLNEKIYIFLWFWISCGIAIQSIAIVAWLLRMSTTRERRRFVKKYLSILNDVDNEERRLATRFVNQFLRHDGIFLLRMIASNVGDLIAAELIQEVWSNWRASKVVAGEASELPNLDATKQLDALAPPATALRTRRKTIRKLPDEDRVGNRRASDLSINNRAVARRNTDFVGSNSPSNQRTDLNTINKITPPAPTFMDANGMVYRRGGLIKDPNEAETNRPPKIEEERASQQGLLEADIV